MLCAPFQSQEGAMTRIRNAFALLILSLISLSACNTFEGIGRDFQELGRSLGL
jgi:predicted small secreted protein